MSPPRRHTSSVSPRIQRSTKTSPLATSCKSKSSKPKSASIMIRSSPPSKPPQNHASSSGTSGAGSRKSSVRKNRDTNSTVYDANDRSAKRSASRRRGSFSHDRGDGVGNSGSGKAEPSAKSRGSSRQGQRPISDCMNISTSNKVRKNGKERTAITDEQKKKPHSSAITKANDNAPRSRPRGPSVVSSPPPHSRSSPSAVTRTGCSVSEKAIANNTAAWPAAADVNQSTNQPALSAPSTSDSNQVGLVEGWLDGLGSFIGLRPPMEIGLSLPLQPSRQSPVASSSAPPPKQSQQPGSGQDRASKNGGNVNKYDRSKSNKTSNTDTRNRNGSRKEDVTRRSSKTMPDSAPGRVSSRNNETTARKRSSVQESSETSPTASSTEQNQSTMPDRRKSGLVPKSPKSSKNKSQQNGASASPTAPTPKNASSSNIQSPPVDLGRSSNKQTKGSPIRLIKQPMVVSSLPPLAHHSKSRWSVAENDQKRRRRYRRLMAAEIVATLEDDDLSDDDDDDDDEVISVKETLIEGMKSWKPTFLLPSKAPLSKTRNDGQRDLRRQDQDIEEGRRSVSRRRRSVTREKEYNRTSELQDKPSGPTRPRSVRTKSSEIKGTKILSKREELERTMNVTSIRSSSKRCDNEKRERESISPPSGNRPVSKVKTNLGHNATDAARIPSKEKKSGALIAQPSNDLVKKNKVHQTPPQHHTKKASPARSTKSARTALTARTSESLTDSPVSSDDVLSPDVLLDIEFGYTRSKSDDDPSSLTTRKRSTETSDLRFSDAAIDASPMLVVDRIPPIMSTLVEETKQKEKEEARREFYANNFALFAHGRVTTVIPVICAGLALILSVIAKRSTSFVNLKEPMLISPTFEKVDRVGLVYLDLCLADQITTIAAGSSIKTVVESDYRSAVGRSSTGDVFGNLLAWANPIPLEQYDLMIEDYDRDDYIFVGPADDEFETDFAGWDETINVLDTREPKICRSIKITSTTLNDNLWHLSRTFLSLAISFGFFLSFILCSATYWSSINLKPVAIGLLATYFFQSMTFFFFDSGICRKHNCSMASGAASAVAASIFWFASAIGCIWMDFVLRAKMRRKKRREKRRRRRERRARRRREARAAFERAKTKVVEKPRKFLSQNADEKLDPECSSSNYAEADCVDIDMADHWLDVTYHADSDLSDTSYADYDEHSVIADDDYWIENGGRARGEGVVR